MAPRCYTVTRGFCLALSETRQARRSKTETPMLNQQPIEKRVAFTGTYDVHSIFYTIQGEGPFCGTPCVFVRLAGCNLQCPLCDTEYTAGRHAMGPYAILAEVNKHLRARKWVNGLVVITGGEPFRQDLTKLLTTLTDAGHYVQVESNGSLPPSYFSFYRVSLDLINRWGVYIVCSPKSGKVNPRTWQFACCAKYVVTEGDIRPEDGLPMRALGHTANPYVARPPEGWDRPIYVQPADEKDEARNRLNIDAARDSCLTHGYTLQLQIHKYIGVE